MKKILCKPLKIFTVILMVLMILVEPFIVIQNVSLVHAVSRKLNSNSISGRFSTAGFPSGQPRPYRHYLYSQRYHKLEFGGDGTFVLFPYAVTVLLDPFNLDFLEDFDQVKAKVAELHAMGVKVLVYKPFSSLSERVNFMEYWNLTARDVAPMDLNGKYYVALPYKLGYEGRDKWREFVIKFIRLLFDAGIDGIEFDGGCGYKNLGSFDPETMRKFNQYLASKYSREELLRRFNIRDINTFNFTKYLRDLGYHRHTVVVGEDTVIAHPGIEGPKDDEYVKALWKEFQNFNLKMLLELYKLIWENVREWEKETGRRFYIFTRIGHIHFNPKAGTEENEVFVLPYVDGTNWEYTWFSSPPFGDRPAIIGYPNRSASVDFRVLQSLNKTFNLWITPFSSLESTGFSEWFSNGWNRTMDPEEQYLALSEIIVCGGRIPVVSGLNRDSFNETHFMQFIRLVQENPHLFGQGQFGEIALIYSVATAINVDDLGLPSVFEGSYDSYEGAYYLLADSHRTFDIIVFGDDNWVNITPSLSQLLKYKAIVLSNVVCLTDSQIELLKQYLERGGIIIGIGEIATHNEKGEPVDREFARYFDGGVHTYGKGLIVSIRDVSTSDYLLLRTRYDPNAKSILEAFRKILDKYVPREVQTNLPSRAHIYRFFNYDENAMIFHIVNFNYDYEADKVVRLYNVNFSFKLPPQLEGKKLSIWVYNEDCPEGIEVPYTAKSGMVSIIIPKVSILTSIEVRPYFEHHKPMIVNKPTVYNGKTIVLDRSLTVNSTLVLLNSQIKVMGGVKPVKIEVLPGGTLVIVNSKIFKESGSYYILARKGSNIFINSSEISGAGLFGTLEMGGICIETENAVVLNSKIHDNYNYGILLFNASYAIIGNNVLYNNSVGCAIVKSSFIELFNNTIVNNSVGVYIDKAAIHHVRVHQALLSKGLKPDTGPTKITILRSKVSDNFNLNIVIKGCNFVTVGETACGGASAINIFAYQSNIIKIYKCEIHSSWIGIYIEECPTSTILNNRIYGNSHIGIKIYKCFTAGVLHWLCVEGGDDVTTTKIIGNYIQDNSYGIHMDTEHGPTGYFNHYIRIQYNTIENNNVGIYVNSTETHIYENNFVKNKKHAIVGRDRRATKFYVNYSRDWFLDAPVGNYWDDYTGTGAEPYKIYPGVFDYFPLTKPVKIPVIRDFEGPYVKIKSAKVVWRDKRFFIRIEYIISDESYVAGNSKLTLGGFAVVHLLGPHMEKELEFPWLGYAEGILGPEELTKRVEGVYNFGEYACNWQPMPAEWLRDASLTLYCTDMWGNWNKNDTSPPRIAVLPRILMGRKAIVIHALVLDWSKVSKVQLMYSVGSSWKTVDMAYDESTHLYFARIPLIREKVIRYKVYARDIYGNDITSKVLSVELHVDTEGPKITDVSRAPEKPTTKDSVKIVANVTDPSGIGQVILSYSTDKKTWHNVTMKLNAKTGLYEAVIPACKTATTVYYKIYASDTVGNWAESETYSYTVSTPPTEVPTRDLTPYIIGVAVLVIVIVVCIILIKRRKAS